MSSQQMEFYGTVDFFHFMVSTIDSGELAQMTEKAPCVASVMLVLKKYCHLVAFRDWGKDLIPSKGILQKEAGVTLWHLNKALEQLEEHGFIKSVGYVKNIKGKKKDIIVPKKKAGGRGVKKQYLFQDKIKISARHNNEVIEAGEILMPLNPKNFRKQQQEVVNALEQLNHGIIPKPDANGLVKVEIKKEVKQIILQVNVDGSTGNITNIGSIGEDGKVATNVADVNEIPDANKQEFQQVMSKALNGELDWGDAVSAYNKNKKNVKEVS